MHKLRSILVGVAVAALLISACGADVGPTANAPPPSQVRAPEERPAEDVAATEHVVPVEWTGPMRAVRGAPVILPMARAAPRADSPAGPIELWGWDEGSSDAGSRWIDVIGVRFTPGTLLTWYVDLAMYPPRTNLLDRDQTLISYGVTIDADEDGVADYELGMSNDVPIPGELRLWITNHATGQTDEHVGRPNGTPYEEWHPDQRMSEDEGRQPRFTLPESALQGVDTAKVRFYAWSSVTNDAAVEVWDYAPDAAWLTLAPETTP